MRVPFPNGKGPRRRSAEIGAGTPFCLSRFQADRRRPGKGVVLSIRPAVYDEVDGVALLDCYSGKRGFRGGAIDDPGCQFSVAAGDDAGAHSVARVQVSLIVFQVTVDINLA